jgi:hypothetical protein
VNWDEGVCPWNILEEETRRQSNPQEWRRRRRRRSQSMKKQKKMKSQSDPQEEEPQEYLFYGPDCRSGEEDMKKTRVSRRRILMKKKIQLREENINEIGGRTTSRTRSEQLKCYTPFDMEMCGTRGCYEKNQQAYKMLVAALRVL